MRKVNPWDLDRPVVNLVNRVTILAQLHENDLHVLDTIVDMLDYIKEEIMKSVSVYSALECIGSYATEVTILNNTIVKIEGMIDDALARMKKENEK